MGRRRRQWQGAAQVRENTGTAWICGRHRNGVTPK